MQALFLHKITAGEIENHLFLLNCILFKFILDHQVIGGVIAPISAPCLSWEVSWWDQLAVTSVVGPASCDLGGGTS